MAPNVFSPVFFLLRQIKKNSKPSLDLNIYFEIFSQRNFAWVGKQKYYGGAQMGPNAPKMVI